MAEEDEEAPPPPPAPSGGPSRYFILVLILLLLEAAGAYMLLDKAVPAPELPPTEDLTEDEVEEVFVAPKYYDGIEHLVFRLQELGDVSSK